MPNHENKFPHPSKEKEFERLLNHFSTQVKGLFFQSDHLKTSAQVQLSAARQAVFPAVLALAQLLEGRDHITYGHSRRIARICTEFATYLKWSPELVQLMNMVGLLHDIGKVIVPDSILMKEGKFTPLEYETMKLHSGTGGRILQRLEFFGKEAEDWVIHHHERFDGKGYPDGLKGLQIPVGARIIAIADAYDAMTEVRRYRQKVPHWIALDEIIKCGGKQFDPELANAFAEAFPSAPNPDLTTQV